MVKRIVSIWEVLLRLLVIDQENGKYSNTKLWANVGYALMTYTFYYAVVYGSKASVELWLVFGGVVVGNRTILKLFNKTPPDKD